MVSAWPIVLDAVEVLRPQAERRREDLVRRLDRGDSIHTNGSSMNDRAGEQEAVHEHGDRRVAHGATGVRRPAASVRRAISSAPAGRGRRSG